ncbi:hypothetical protein AOLI_G00126560 [Acnodon oligacanthus]
MDGLNFIRLQGREVSRIGEWGGWFGGVEVLGYWRVPEALADKGGKERESFAIERVSIIARPSSLLLGPYRHAVLSDLGGPSWRTREREREREKERDSHQLLFCRPAWSQPSAPGPAFCWPFCTTPSVPLTQGFDAYVLKVAAAVTQASWQMVDLQASAGQAGVHFRTFFCLSVLDEDSAVQKTFFCCMRERGEGG